MSRPLSPADALWLAIERPENLMVITAVLEFDGPVDVPRLRNLLLTDLPARYPRFRRRIRPGRWPGRRPRWEDVAGLDPDYHLGRVRTDGSPAQGVAAAVAAALSTPLDLGRPPWRFVLVETPAAAALVARLHHCLADGIALAEVLLALTDGPPVRAARPGPDRGRPGVLRLLPGFAAAARQVLTAPRQPPGVLAGPLGTAKVAAWDDAVDLTALRAAAAGLGCSVNDVLLSVVAGALRRTLLAAGEAPRDTAVLVPVNLRAAGAPPSLGNRFGVLFLPLPVREPHALARVSAVAAATRALRAGPRGGAQPAAGFVLLTALGALPAAASRSVVRLLTAVFGSRVGAVVTNVPGPQELRFLAGSEVRRIAYWVPQPGPVGLGVSIFSYAGRVTIGVAADARLGADPQRLLAAVAAEWAAVQAALPG